MIPRLASIHCHHDGAKLADAEVRPCPGTNNPESVQIRIQVGAHAIYLEMDRSHAESIANDITNYFTGVDHDAEVKAVNHVQS